jgi:hypothetical protein
VRQRDLRRTEFVFEETSSGIWPDVLSQVGPRAQSGRAGADGRALHRVVEAKRWGASEVGTGGMAGQCKVRSQSLFGLFVVLSLPFYIGPQSIWVFWKVYQSYPRGGDGTAFSIPAKHVPVPLRIKPITRIRDFLECLIVGDDTIFVN